MQACLALVQITESGFGLRAVWNSCSRFYCGYASLELTLVSGFGQECLSAAYLPKKERLASTVEWGGNPPFMKVSDRLTGMRCLTEGTVRQRSLLCRSTAVDRRRRYAGAGTIEVP